METNYKPFRISFLKPDDTEITVTSESSDGGAWITIGKLDLRIRQREDGEGVIIYAMDSATSMQDLGKMMIYYNDIEEEDES